MVSMHIAFCVRVTEKKDCADFWREREQAFQRGYMKKFINTPVLKQGDGHLPDKSIHSSRHSHPQMDYPLSDSLEGGSIITTLRPGTSLHYSCVLLYGDNCQLRMLLVGENLPTSFMLLFSDFNTKNQIIC